MDFFLQLVQQFIAEQDTLVENLQISRESFFHALFPRSFSENLWAQSPDTDHITSDFENIF